MKLFTKFKNTLKKPVENPSSDNTLPINDSGRCVCCGEEIPEGRQYCPKCGDILEDS